MTAGNGSSHRTSRESDVSPSLLAAARAWMVGQSGGAARRADARADEYLRMAALATDLNCIGVLSGRKQAKALYQIAIRGSGALSDSTVEDALKIEFLSRIPQLLSDAPTSDAFDARLAFWEMLLSPAGRVARLSAVVRAAVIAALRAQLSSPFQELRWSAARGVAQLDAATAKGVRDALPELFADSTLRTLSFPEP